MSDEALNVSTPSPAPSAPAASEPTETGSNIGTGNDVGVTQSEGQNTPPADVQAGEETPQEGVEPKAPNPELYKLVIDGKEEEVTKDELIRRAQKYAAADKRFQKAAEIQKQHELVIDTLKESPVEALTRVHGPEKARELMEKYLYEQLQYDQLTPEQKRLKELEKENQALKGQKQKEEEQKAAEAEQKLQTQYKADYEKKILSALETSGLPVSEDTISRMAFYMRHALQQGIDAPMDLIVEQVREDLSHRSKSLISKLKGPELLKLLGDDVIKLIREADLEALKSGTPTVPSAPPQTPIGNQNNESKKPKRYISMDEARAEIERKINS